MSVAAPPARKGVRGLETEADHRGGIDMPVIIVKARRGVLKGRKKKGRLIEDLAAAFAEAAGDESYRQSVTVVIEEVPNENWGRAGRQVTPDGS